MRRTERGAYLALAVVLVVVVFANDWGAFTYDTKPELYQAPWRTLLRELSAWRPSPHLGQANYHIGFAPVVFVVWVIRSLGAEAWVAARVLRVALLLIGSWGMVRHLRVLAPEVGPAARITAAIVYAANPYAIVSGATLPVLLPYAFLPWLLDAFLASLSAPRSWRGPAAFALAFFAMGGMNAGVVPLLSLLALPAYLLYARLAEGRRGLAAPLVRCALLALGVSLYWLLPSVLASGAGADVAANTERPDAVAQTSSYAESLRLLGMWTMYGQIDGRLFTPAFAAYLTNPLAVLASFAVPLAAAAAALVSRARARLLAVLLLAIALPVMVGLFPPQAPSPFGRLLAEAFARVPGAIAFRTTNKAGALAALAITLLLALGVQELLRRRVLIGLAVLVFVGATLPAWTGDLHPTRSDIPAYWREAAAELDAQGSPGRVLFVPGQSLARYRWGHEGVDDLDASLLARPVVWRPTVPAGSAAAANFLAALDVGLNEAAIGHGVLPAFARYAGADTVLLRDDVDWQRADGAAPEVLAGIVAADPELQPRAQHGALRSFAVSDPRLPVRAEAAAGVLLIDGDNFALPSLHASRMLDGEPAYRLLAELDADEFATALADGARIVLTDTNRRREWHIQHTGRAFSPTLPASAQVDQATSRTLYDDPDAQTVAVVEGGSATASSFGSPFYPTPFGAPEAAFDGDPATAWLVGSFNTAVGQSLTLDLDRQQAIDGLVLHPVLQPGVRIAAVRLTYGGRSVERMLPDEPIVPLELPQATARELTITITQLRGVGRNAVGFREVEIDGVRLETVARLPRSAALLSARLDEAALRDTPLDVVLTREAGDPADPADDEERRLSRAFDLPVARSFALDGVATAGPDLPDQILDRLAGLPGDVTVGSSSRGVDGLAVRAAKALDGDRDTAWEPDPADPRPWLQVRFPQQRLSGIEIEQGPGVGLATEVVLDFDSGPPVRARLSGGRERISFAPRTTAGLRIEVRERGGFDAPVRIAELAIGSAALPAPPGDTPLRCGPLLEVDGAPVEVALDGTVADLERGAALPIAGCGGEPLALDAGEVRLRATDGWLVDRLHLSSGAVAMPPPAAPASTVVASSATALDVEVEQADGPYYLVTGQAYDERWRATMDGADLGPPILVDGYAAGWRIDDLAAHTFAVVYTPQSVVVWTRWISVTALLGCLALLVRSRRAPVADMPARGFGQAWWALAPALLWVVLGTVGLVLGAGLAAWHLLRPFAPRTLLRAAVALLALVPLAWLAQGLPDLADITPALVTTRLLPHHLAGAGLALLVLGVVRDHSRATTSSSSRAASSAARSRARSDSVEVPPLSPAAPNATAERPRATGNRSSRSAAGRA